MKRKIIPTVFARNKKEFSERFRKLIALKRDLQIDFMDGKFVKARGIFLKDVPDLHRYKARFEAHLMVKNPEKYIDKLKSKGFKKIIFHYESIKDYDKIKRLIGKIKNKKMKVWIALNPDTKLSRIKYFADEVDGVLFMGVYPGKEKQKFVSEVYGKIRKLRKSNRKIKIQVDGGVDLSAAEKLRKIGVDCINSGSFVSDAKSPAKALMELERAFR